MAINTITKEQSLFNSFNYQTQAAITLFQQGKLQINTVESCHSQIHQLFINSMIEMDKLKTQIHSETTHLNQQVMIKRIENITDYENKFLEKLTLFTNATLSCFPNAKIKDGILRELSLSNKFNSFNHQITAALTLFQQGKLQIDTVESCHSQIQQSFTNLMNEIAELKAQIHAETTYQNQEVMFKRIENITEYESKFLEKLTLFTNAILTYFPTAKIQYGTPCVNAPSRPFIDTSNKQILSTLAKASYMREIRGDGNCFASALTTRLLETLVQNKEISKFIEFVSNDRIHAPALKEEIIGTLTYLEKFPNQIENILKDNHKVLPFINYLRQLTALEMKENRDDYAIYFLDEIKEIYGENVDNKTYESLVDKYVLKMGVDYSHPTITALCKKLQFSIQIIDPKIGNPNGFNVLENVAQSGTFFRHDNHYFILYNNEKPPLIHPVQPSGKTTEMIIHCPVPAGHCLFIRGSGEGLNWDKGLPLIELSDGYWMYGSLAALNNIEYKFLIDDTLWENGENHKIVNGELDNSNPVFEISNLSNQDLKPNVQKTKITVIYNAEKGSKLFIRGDGPGMSWDRGVELQHLGNNVWSFETEKEFEKFEYKILLNDNTWETSPNHTTNCGKEENINPQF